MSKAAPLRGEQILLDLGRIHQIPTDNAEAALRFCRALARQLGSGAAAALEHQDGAYAGSHLAASSQNAAEPELSVVIPVYNEEENIPVLYDRLLRTLEGANINFEIVFVDDGSRDQSIAKLNEIGASDQRVVVIELARNFGHQVAITAGLDFARGKAVAVMDADLQDPPEVLPAFVAKWREGHEVVYAIRARRQETWFLRASYAAFYRLLRRVANVEIPLDAGDFCVMDRRVVDLLKSMPERNRFVRGIRSWVGFSQVGLPFERHARHAGASKYTFGRLTLLALDGLFSFSYVPLRIITVLGFSISLLSILAALFYAITRLLTGLGPPGFATLVVAVFFLAGVQLITIGVIGEYVGRIFEEVKRRPLYIMRKVTRG
ncbi:MAG: glycosyltransferase family 2 protein [Candidatus Binatia bacterium]